MTEPDEALLWAREHWANICHEDGFPDEAEAYRQGVKDESLATDALFYRAGAAASEARINALEEANAALEDMASRYAIQMSDMLTRLGERHPEDFVWLKEGDQ